MGGIMVRLVVAVAVGLASGVASARDVELSHSGRLLDASGVPVDGPVDLTVRLFSQADAAAPVVQAWEDTFGGVAVESGYFAVTLGSGAPLSSSVFDAETVWVEYQIGTNAPLAPRQRLFGVPLAESARGVVARPTPPSHICDGAGTMQWDSGEGRLLVCDGTTWQAITTTPVPPPPMTLQPGPTDGVDTFVRSSIPTGTWGDAENLRAGGWGDSYYSFVRFDLSGLPTIPATSAVISFYVYSTTNPMPVNVAVVDGPWSEATTWNTQPAATHLFQIPTPTAGQWIDLDITSTYNEWIAGTRTNHGVRISPTGTNNNWSEIRSSDYLADPTQRPKLTVTW